METLDIIILVCFIPAIIRGLQKGFIEQAIALISLVLGAWMAFHFSSVVSAWLQPYLDVSETVLSVISFAVIMIAVVLLLFLLGRLLTGIVKLVMLGWMDRLLGLVFAILKAALIIGLAVVLFDTLNLKFEFVKAEVLDTSVLYNPIKDLAYAIFPYLKELVFKQ
ncbi:MAG: CvpA family protein [Bacteroidia bacterium]|nr:CvpA family protein [Bacteroidia bacterium]